jgi:hypothetical protein
MKRTVVALIAGVLAAGAGAGQALADEAPKPSSPSQTVAQLAGNHQSADSSATSTQIKPENTNVSVRVLSPGSSGSVSQSNTSGAAAVAANANNLAQSATQNAGASNPGYSTPVQSAAQVATSKQDADAWADSTQVKPKNTNVSVRVLSPGDDGDVTQENSSAAIAAALNKNDTTQTATQDAGSGSPVQTAAQVAENDQYADAYAKSKQIEPKNTNVSVRVLSEGNNGSVDQTNSSKAIGIGANLNRTEQTTTQSGDGYDGKAIQDAAQVAKSKQDADAWAESVQVKPKNTNVSVRVLSPGDDGDVSQENSSFALGVAANKNHTDQTVTQEQNGGYGDVAVQAAGQIASNDQDAWSSADSIQIKPENSNLSVRTVDLDKGHDKDGHKPEHEDGDGGDVSQTNSSKALALSLNVNDLVQTADQSRGGDEGTTAGPEDYEPSMSTPNEEPKDDSKEEPNHDEEDGGVSQLNKSLAAALSANLNRTTQTATQSQGDDKADVAIQAIGQVAGNKQEADANADSFQLGASNENGSLSELDLCKHRDFCKPEKPECRHDSCKPEKPDCKHDWCKPDPCKRPDFCKPEKPECKHDWCKPDDGKRCHDPWGHRKCKPDHDRPWPASRQVMPDAS